jgi:predicted ester cyclase
VVTRGVFAGTHRGDFMGIPATGRKVSIKYLDIWRLENGKAKENWVQMDMLGMMQQLGVIPAPEQATA